MAAQLFGDGLDLARRNALYVHLHHRRHQRFLAALVPLEYLGPEPPLPVLRHPQLDLAHARHQRPAVVTRPVAQPARRALAFARLQRLVHLRFQHLLQRLSSTITFSRSRSSANNLPVSIFCRDLLSRYPAFGSSVSFPFFQPLTEFERSSLTHSPFCRILQLNPPQFASRFSAGGDYRILTYAASIIAMGDCYTLARRRMCGKPRTSVARLQIIWIRGTMPHF